MTQQQPNGTTQHGMSDFPLDVDEALLSGIYGCGATGSGKSDVLMYVADRLMKERAVTIYVVDPSQDWMHRSNIPHVITVPPKTLHAKVYNASTIYDISLLRGRKKKREFMEDLCNILYDHAVNQPKKERTWKFIIFEEAQLVFPEGSFRSDQYNSCVELVSTGRNYKLRFGAITPFSANVDKMLVKTAQQRYFGWTCEKNDTEYVKGFIGDTATQLKHLKAGQFYYHQPTHDVLRKIGIRPHARTVPLINLTPPVHPTSPINHAPHPLTQQAAPAPTEGVSEAMRKIAVVLGGIGFIIFITSMFLY